MIWWNGEPLPIPAAPLQYSYRDIEGANSGQTLGGSYSKKVIARKEDVLATWSDLTAEEAAIIARIKNSVYGSLTFYSPQLGRFITRTVYTEDVSAEITSATFDGGALRTDTSLSVQFRQR